MRLRVRRSEPCPLGLPPFRTSTFTSQTLFYCSQIFSSFQHRIISSPSISSDYFHFHGFHQRLQSIFLISVLRVISNTRISFLAASSVSPRKEKNLKQRCKCSCEASFRASKPRDSSQDLVNLIKQRLSEKKNPGHGIPATSSGSHRPIDS